MSDFTNLYFRVAYYSKNNAIYEIHTNAPEMSNDDIMAMGRYIYYSETPTTLRSGRTSNPTFRVSRR